MGLINNFRKTTESARHKNIADAAALDDNLLEKISGGVDMETTVIDVTGQAGAGMAGKITKKVIK